MAPKRRPAELRGRRHDGIVAALDEPKTREPFAALGFEPVANPPAPFAAFRPRESARWKPLIDSRRITAD